MADTKTTTGMKLAMTAVAATLTVVLVHAGQAPVATKSDDVLPALLTEVRGLRAAMEQMASAGPRIQLFLGRLQLQEARITSMARRLEAVRDEIRAAERAVDERKAELGRTEKWLTDGSLRPEQIEGHQASLPRLRRDITMAGANVTRLAAEETQLAQDLTAEQGRWLEMNQRLDELEKALVKR